MGVLNNIIDYYQEEEILKADGFDEAVICIEEGSMRLIYSVSRCIEILVVRDEMSLEESLDYFNYNVSGSYVGEKTPIWCQDMLEI